MEKIINIFLILSIWLYIIFIINNILNYFYRLYLEKKIKKISLDKNPLVSILIPARNEALSIRKCVISLVRQTYKNLEVIVLNDHSTDDTIGILKQLKSTYSNLNLTIVEGKSLPKNWLGKNWACYQLSKTSYWGSFVFYRCRCFID